MFLKIAVFVVAGIAFLLLVKRNSPGFVILCEITIIAITIVAISPEIENILSVLDSFEGVSSVGDISLKIMFKAFGILAVGAVVADVCRDNGESAVAGVVELSVKVLAISCALPVFSAVVEIASTFFNS